MDLTLTDEQRAVVANVRRFVTEEILPREAELDPDASELDPADHAHLVAKAKAMGLYNLDLPEEYGGAGLDTTTMSLIAIEMSQHRAGLYAPCYRTFGEPGVLGLLADWVNEDQRERYLEPVRRGEKTSCFALTEPSGGSDPGRNLRTRAVKDGTDWILNGSKIFISHAADADFALVFARTGPPESGREGITCFLVDTDTPGFYVRRVVHTLRAGHPGTELQFEDLRVPEANILGGLNQGFKLANDRLVRNRIPYGAGCIGVAVKAQQLAIDYANVRVAFNKRLSEHQGIEWMLVDNEQDIRTATMLTLYAASRADRGLPYRTEAASAKILATEAASRVVDRAIQIHGGMGVAREMPLERWYRELRIRRIGEGATEVQKMIIGRDLTRNPYRFFLQ